MKLSQTGRFTLPRRFIERETDAVMELMRFMLVVRAECLFLEDVIEYTAISDRFEEVTPGVCPPTYYLIQTRLDGKLHFALEREAKYAAN
jgi:hypothetical protein